MQFFLYKDVSQKTLSYFASIVYKRYKRACNTHHHRQFYLDLINGTLHFWSIISKFSFQNISSCRLTSNNYATKMLLDMKSLHCYNTICVCLHGMYARGNMFRIYPFPIIDREMKRITFLAIWKVVWSISTYHSIL